MVTQLIYYSENQVSNGLQGIRDIMSKAIQNNTALGISGILYYNENFFLQVLEGGREEVNTILAKLFKDSRHTNMVVFSVKKLDKRNFRQWGMVYIHEGSIHASDFEKYIPKGGFDPREMTTEELVSMALEIQTHYLNNEEG